MSTNIPNLNLHTTTAAMFAQSMKVFLLFNKVTDAFYCWVGYHENEGFSNTFNIAVCESFNPSTQEIVGDFNSWEVVDKANQPTKIYEEAIDKATSDVILEKHSIAKQLNTISGALTDALQRAGLDNATKSIQQLFTQVAEINEIIKNGERRKEGYKKDPGFIYVSRKDQVEQNNQRYEGGVGELTGPRKVL